MFRDLPTFICVTETWFKPETLIDSYHLSEYEMYNNCRKGTCGGGVTIYANNTLSAVTYRDYLSIIFIETVFESIFIECNVL